MANRTEQVVQLNAQLKKYLRVNDAEGNSVKNLAESIRPKLGDETYQQIIRCAKVFKQVSDSGKAPNDEEMAAYLNDIKAATLALHQLAVPVFPEEQKQPKKKGGLAFFLFILLLIGGAAGWLYIRKNGLPFKLPF